jgi:hypothetical protein
MSKVTARLPGVVTRVTRHRRKSMLTGKVPETFSPSEGASEPFMVPPNMYLLRFLDAELAPDNGNRNPDWGPSWRWHFEVADQSGKLIMSETPGTDGKPRPKVYWAYTSDKLGMTPQKQKSKARQYFEALLDRDILPGEDLSDLVTSCQGKVAKALLTHKKSQSTEKTSVVIAQMMPLDPETASKVKLANGATSTPVAEVEVPF